jgi:signal transduction histidine kinase/ligand-binding sensor domain-containing protein
LFLLRNGVLSSYAEKSGAPGISAIIEDRGGTIWLTRYRLNDGQGPLCRVTGATLQCFGKNDGLSSPWGLGLAEDSQGSIWFGCRALCRWAPGSSEIYFKEQFRNTSGNGVSRVAIGPLGTVWATLEGIGPKLGVQYYKDGKWSSYVVPGFDGRTVVSEVLFIDSNQTLWVGTESAGLYHIHDGFADHYGSAQGLSGNYVLGIYEDKESNIWVTTDRGIDLFRDFAVATFSGNEGLVGQEVHSVFALSDGSVWAANNKALDIIRPGGISAITTGRGLPGQAVEAIFKDSAGRMWLGIDKKIMTYKQGRFLPVKKSDGSSAGLVGGASAFAEDIEGNVWALTDLDESGQLWLLRIRGDRIEKRSRIDKLFPEALHIAADRGGNIWILSLHGKLGRWRNGIGEAVVTLDDAGSLAAYSLSIDSDNAVLVTTSKGLFRWKDGNLSRMDSSNGLPCSTVYSVIKDNNGAVWLYERCALVRISMSDWASWVKSPESKVSVKVYDALDGAQPDIAAPYQPLVSRSSDGRLWFASNSFVQMVDPGRDSTNAIPPPVHIEELLADHKNYADLKSLKLPPLFGELEISYTALSLAVPRRVLFRYKLEGHDVAWQEAGTRRQAFYNDLGPGHYRFRVIASNNDGVWNEAGAFLDFSILPAYYQTTWFRASCAATFLLLLWAIYQFRVQQLHRRFAIGLEARVNERTRIARELHDTLLQSLHGVMFQFQAARNLLPRRPDEAMQSLDEAIDETQKALAESRDAIQGLRSEPIAKGNLVELLMAASQELASSETSDHQPPAFELIEEGEHRILSPASNNEVCRIALEILRNAYRHAQAHRIEAEVRYADHTLRVRIRDDGKGIDPKVLKEGGIAGHWGLRGVRERAERIGAQLDFWSEAGAGTEVQLTVPASVAYESSPDGVRSRLLSKIRNRAQHS